MGDSLGGSLLEVALPSNRIVGGGGVSGDLIWGEQDEGGIRS